MTHPIEERLNAWVDGESGDESAMIAAHVASCAQCRRAVDGIRLAGAAVRAWADAETPALSGDLADVVFREAANSDGAKTAEPRESKSNVVPLGARRRWVWGAIPATAIAVAAAAVFALLIRRPHPLHRTQRETASSVTDAGGHSIMVAKAADDRPHGTVVLSVEPADDRTTYSVMEVPGGQEGTMTSVVWIEDETTAGLGAVQ